MDEWTLRAGREASEAQQELFKAQLEGSDEPIDWDGLDWTQPAPKSPVVFNLDCWDELFESPDPLAPARGARNAFMAAVFFWGAVVIAVLLWW